MHQSPTRVWHINLIGPTKFLPFCFPWWNIFHPELNVPPFTPSGQTVRRDKRVCPYGPAETNDFIPSRGRVMSALAATAISGSPPSGRALPSLIRVSPQSAAEHVRAARVVSPIASLITVAFPSAVRNLLSSHLADPVGTVARRVRALDTFRSISAKLQHYRNANDESPSGHINLPLLLLLVRRFNYADQKIIEDLMLGMPIAGDIPECQSLMPRVKPATLSMEEWSKLIPERNKEAINRVERFRTTELGAECWRKTLSEIKAGWVSEPSPLSQHVAETVNLTPRYAIFEQHGDGPRKVRIVDDLKASGVNAVTNTKDTAVPDSLDTFLALTSYYRLIRPGCDLRAASSDFCHAYKNVGIPPDQGRFPTVLLGPPTGPLLVSRLLTQPFGSTRAPANWGRVTRLIQWILFAYFGIHLPIYVDDCFVVEPAETVDSAFSCVNELIELCGFKMGKFAEPSVSILLLGAAISIQPDFATASLPGRRRDALITDIMKILCPGSLSPGCAAKLRGRRGFAQSLMFGRFGRVLLQPLTNRQYCRASRGAHQLNAELREVLPWWAAVLRGMAERRTWFHGPRPVVVYVDAAGCGHLGVIIFVGGSSSTFSTRIPERMIDAGAGIYDMEAMASLYGLCVVAELYPDRAVILCCDNRGANQTLVRGACKSPFSRMSCAAFSGAWPRRLVSPCGLKMYRGKPTQQTHLLGIVFFVTPQSTSN